MNKILVSDIINLSNEDYILNIKNKDAIINIEGNVKLYLINELINKINFNLKDNSNLVIYLFNNNIKNKTIFNINQNNKTKLNLNISIINNDNCELIVNNNLNGNNNESIIKSRLVSNKKFNKLIINAYIDKNTLNNIALEDLKGINNGGVVHIEPNIICLSNEVSANHLTTIGNFSKESVNYLMSKGLNQDLAKQIMLKGFIYSNMDEYIKNWEVNNA